MAKLVLLRHGQSLWNKKNIFTGWVDVPLSREGVDEAFRAGERIKHIPFDYVFTSTLCRAQLTAFIVLSVHDEGKTPVVIHPEESTLQRWGKIYDSETAEDTIPVIYAWELNERMYGQLQGRNKEKTRNEFGADQVKLWRRSFATPPPEGESLKDTAARTLPYFQKEIVGILDGGNNVLISAHGNSLRALVMHLDGLSEDEVLKLELPTGDPLCYTYDEGRWTKNALQ